MVIITLKHRLVQQLLCISTCTQILMNVDHLLVNTPVLILQAVLHVFVEMDMNSTVMEGLALVQVYVMLCTCLPANVILEIFFMYITIVKIAFE